MSYRLLIDFEAVEFLRGVKRSDQLLLHHRLRQIQEFPSQHVDYVERDSTDRELFVNVCGRFAITFWEDFADRHVKVLDICRADN